MSEQTFLECPLGKTSTYICTYDPTLLFPIPRKLNREAIGIDGNLPFQGVDIWNAYEMSWLNDKGKPLVALGSIWFPCSTENIIESKSLKLYLNSLNQTKFATINEVKKTIEEDLSKAVQGSVKIVFSQPDEWSYEKIENFPGFCLDDLDIEIDTYDLKPEFLTAAGHVVEETLHSHLLKSNCRVTGQPDWGSLMISYKGQQIDKASLLKYVVSFRNINEFGEQCVERIFMDIKRYCQPLELTVYARYTRRGGLDINPFRSTLAAIPTNKRQSRQ